MEKHVNNGHGGVPWAPPLNPTLTLTMCSDKTLNYDCAKLSH